MSAADRQLLFGILALQNNFIDRHQLVRGFGEWVADKRVELPQILVAHGALTSDLARLLDQLVDQHQAVHGGVPKASLKALSSVSPLEDDLRTLNDQDLNASLMAAGVHKREDPYGTLSVGRITSQGGRFEFRRALGRGGLGIVSIALDTELNREVALKEIRTDRADEEAMRRKFMVEAEVTGNLEHPGIVPVYGLGVNAAGRPFYAMRFIRGDNLGVHVKEFHRQLAQGVCRFDGPELRGLLRRFLDICDAISYAHSRGVLHRDLKPGNIMLGRFGETLVVDWGLAKTTGQSGESTEVHVDLPIVPKLVESDATRMGSIIGTPAYAPPEQLRGEVEAINERSDVYGLGAILYEVLCNTPPASGKTLEEVLANISQGRIQSPREKNPTVPPGLAEICMKALATRPADRYVSATALMNDVEAWLDDLPVAAMPDNLLGRASRWFRRNRGVALAVASSLVIITLVASGAAWANHLLRVDADAARAEAERQQQVADKYFHQARNAVDRFLTNVSQDPQLANSGFLAVRRRLLQDAMDYYQQFADASHDDSAETKRQLAATTMRMAQIHQSLGQHLPGLKLADSAAEQFRALADDDSRLDERLDFAECEILRAELQHETGKLLDAARTAESTTTMLEQWRTAQPKHLRLGQLLITSIELAAQSAHAQLDRDKAIELIDKAIRLSAEISQEHQSVQKDQHRLRVKQAAYMSERSDYASAIAQLNTVVEITEEKTKSGADQYYLELLGEVEHQLGVAYSGEQAWDDAMVHFQQAVAARDRLVESNTVASHQSVLAKSLSDLAVILKNKKKLPESREAARQAFEICQRIVRNNPDSSEYRLHLAESMIKVSEGESDERATQLLQEADGIIRQMLQEQAVRLGARLHVVDAINALAGRYYDTKQYTDALRLHEQALEQYSQMAKEHPQDYQVHFAIARTLFRIAADHSRMAQHPLAIENYRRSIATLDQLTPPSAVDNGIPSQLIYAFHGMALSQVAVGQYSEALVTVDLADAQLAKLQEEDRRSQLADICLKVRSDALRGLTKYQAAAETALQRRAYLPDSPEQALNIARLIAKCIVAIDRSENPGPPELRSRLAEWVIDELQRAAKSGLKDADAIRKTPDFAPLIETPRLLETLQLMDKPETAN